MAANNYIKIIIFRNKIQYFEWNRTIKTSSVNMKYDQQMESTEPETCISLTATTTLTNPRVEQRLIPFLLVVFAAAL